MSLQHDRPTPFGQGRDLCIRIECVEVPAYLACGWSLAPEEPYAISGFQTLIPPPALLENRA